MSEFTDKLANDLKDAGIEYAFGVVGSGASLELVTALEKQGVVYYPVAHEAAGVLMAGACCRNGKTRAVAITIKGPGFSNALPGIVSNYYENRPALTISEAYAPTAPSSKMHKRLDHFSMASTVLNGFASGELDDGAIKKLIEMGGSDLPGPIHIYLFQGSASFRKETVKFEITYPFADILKKISDALAMSKKPLIILGSLAARNLPDINWQEFKIPVLTTAAAKGAINEFSEFSGGVITGEIKELSPEKILMAKADLIVSVGLRNTEVVSASKYLTHHINIDLVDGFAGGFEPKINFIAANADLEKIILALKPEISKKTWGQDLIATYLETLEKELFLAEWMPANVFRQIQQSLPDSTAVLDTGLFCTIGETVWRAGKPENFLGSSNGRFMGTAIPTAIGFAVSSKRETVCFAGDGGIRNYFPEIKLAVSEKLPIIFVFMSDGGYGSVAMAGRPKGLNAKGYDIKNGSWWRAASAIGCDAELVENAPALLAALSKWKKRKGPLFLELHFDQARYGAMTNKLR